MEILTFKNHTTKKDKLLAKNSHEALNELMKNEDLSNSTVELQINHKQIQIPTQIIQVLSSVLQAIGKGKQLSIIESSNLITTQEAAEILGCSRPHVVKLTREGIVPYSTVGKHRRVKIEDIFHYKKQLKQNQKILIKEIMVTDEEAGLYETE